MGFSWVSLNTLTYTSELILCSAIRQEQKEIINDLPIFPCRRYRTLRSVHNAVFGRNGRHYFFKSLVGRIIPFKLSNKQQIEYNERKC